MFNTPQEEEYQNKPCIVVMDYACKNKRSGADMDKVLVFKWIPDTCSKIRQKMVYSSAWWVCCCVRLYLEMSSFLGKDDPELLSKGQLSVDFLPSFYNFPSDGNSEWNFVRMLVILPIMAIITRMAKMTTVCHSLGISLPCQKGGERHVIPALLII